MWYEWISLELFNEWHKKIKLQLEIPNEQTKEYTQPFEVDGKIIAFVDIEFAKGLVETDLRVKPIDRFNFEKTNSL